MDPIFDALVRGERFSFDLLKEHTEATEKYWKYWWHKVDRAQLQRPMTISDDDEILRVTANLGTVDTEKYLHFYYSSAQELFRNGKLPLGCLARETYRNAVVEQQVARLQPSECPILTFVGGGYGAGKTTTLNFLSGKMPGITVALGVDQCKLLLPEFHQIRMVSDGRASEVCQEESRLISDKVFDAALMRRADFCWDSSMSQFEPTMEKIKKAIAQGYRLRMIGVWTPLEKAIPRAMNRAYETRRFANPKYLEKATKDFARHFPRYFDCFDEVILFGNAGAEPILIAEKMHSGLEIHCQIAEEFIKFGELHENENEQ